MKRLTTFIILLIAALLWSNSIFSQGIAIGEGDSSPHASAILDLQSTQHGLLIPRMTTAQRGEIKSPAEGLLIYNTTTDKLDIYTGAEGWYSLEAISDGAATGSTAPGGGISVNETGADPHDVAILDVSSTEKGFLLPRTEPTTVSGPTESLIIFNTISKRLTIYNGSDWAELLHNAESTATTAGTGSQTGMLISNTDDTQPHHSAILELRSTNGKGLLVPRMTTAQRNALAPVQGVIIYNNETQTINYCTGAVWNKLDDGSWACGDNVTFTYNGSEVTYGTVESQGRCWLDRNLGASQVAVSSTDADAYGDLFQWGRGTDGHQIRNPLSGTTATNSTTDSPGHSNFITESSYPYDWRVPQNVNLWQGVDGINNPCPSGWRVPTEAEWNTERLSWSSNYFGGAFDSSLKLPKAGVRGWNGSFYIVGSSGRYWSCIVDGNDSRYLRFDSSNANMYSAVRAYGFSVRCIKDCPFPEQPTQGSLTPSETQIIWNWNTALGAEGYKYNTVNDYATATDNGTSTSYTQEGLDCETEYTLYVWAFNECGTSVVLQLTAETNPCSFTCGDNYTDPRDGNVYATVQIGSQCWMAENLRATVYNDNAPITNMADVPDCETYTEGSYSWYESNPVTYADYGVYYTWYAVETGKLCPSGWHVPSQAEFNDLINHLGGSAVAGGALKETGTAHWNNPNVGATNSSGFTALGGGDYYCPMNSFSGMGINGEFWSSTIADPQTAYFLGIPVEDTYVVLIGFNKTSGFNVRCVKSEMP